MQYKKFTQPFPHIEIIDFLPHQKAIILLKAVLKESFHPKETDLFKFKQTSSLVESKNKSIQEFIKDILMDKETTIKFNQ